MTTGREGTELIAARTDRLDRLVAHSLGVSRRAARLLIARGEVSVNGRVIRILSRDVPSGARIAIAPEAGESEIAPEAAPAHPKVRILFLDPWIVVVNKPAGLLSETDRFGSPSIETVVPRLLAETGEKKTLVRLVHRLDAGTSGVLIMARTPAATAALGKCFAEGLIHKTYLAICTGNLNDARTIDLPIGRRRGVKHAVDTLGKSARTEVEPISTSPQASLVRARPLTGRTHQIRVHLSHIGHPLFGDRLYGGPGYTATAPIVAIPRAMLHAARLDLPHPKTGAAMSFTAPVPVDFEALACRLGVWPVGGLSV